MIFGFAIVIIGAIIQFFVAILNTLQWNFPIQFVSAIQIFFGVLTAFSGFLPFIGDIIAIILILVPAYIIRYVFDIILWGWSLVPWIGTSTQIPSGAPLDLRRNAKAGELDLRNGRIKKSKKRWLTDTHN